MVKVGRNSLCPCGSGKKYKLCCINKKNADTLENKYHNYDEYIDNIYTLQREIDKEEIIPSNSILDSKKNYILSNLEQLIYHLKYEKVRNDKFIINKSKLILYLLNCSEEEHLSILESFLKKLIFINNTPNEIINKYKVEYKFLDENITYKNKLNSMEKALLASVTKSTLLEYKIEPTIDYGAIRVLNEFCYRAIRSNTVEEKYDPMPQMYVTSKDTLVDWKFNYRKNFETNYTINKNIMINWKKAEKEIEIINQLSGLSEISLKIIYNIMVNKDEYSEYQMYENYMNIINCEYKRLLNLKVNNDFDETYNIKSNAIILKNIIENELVEGIHLQKIKELNKVLSKFKKDFIYKDLSEDEYYNYNEKNFGINTLNEIDKILFEDKLLILLSDEILKIKKNRNIDFILKTLNLYENKIKFIKFYNEKTTKLSDLINFIENNKEIKDLRLNSNELNLEFGYYRDSANSKIPKTYYAFDKGIKELILADFDQLKHILHKNKIDRNNVEFFIEDINSLSYIKNKNDIDRIKKLYSKEVIEELKRRGKKSQGVIINGINDIDCSVLKCINIIITEFNKIYHKLISSENFEQNYKLILILVDSAMKILNNNQQYITKSLINPMIKIFIDDEIDLIDFVILESENFAVIQNQIEFENINYLYSEKSDFAYKIENMSSQTGKKAYITAEMLHKDIKEHQDIDYSPYCDGYFKCIECELKESMRDILEKVDKIKKNITLGSFDWVFRNKKDNIENLLGKKIDVKFIEQLSYITKQRNISKHEDVININEYKTIRKIIIEDGLLDYILNLNNKKSKYILRNKEINNLELEIKKIKLELDYDEYLNIKENLQDSKYNRINFLNQISNIFFNDPICNIVNNRFISSEIDYDEFGFILIKNNRINKKGIGGISYNYSGYNYEEVDFKLLFRGEIVQKSFEIPGYFAIRYEDNQLIIDGNEGANTIRNYLYQNLYDIKELSNGLNDSKSLNENQMYEIYFKAINNYLDLINSNIENGINAFQQDTKNVILLNEIFKGFNHKINTSFDIIRNVLLILFDRELKCNIDSQYELGKREKIILIKLCRFIIENLDELSKFNEFDYIDKVYVSIDNDENIKGIKLNKSKKNINLEFEVEIIYE